MECSFEPCDREARSKGLCWAHYAQQRRGQPLRPLHNRPGWHGRERIQPLSCSFDGCGRKPNGKGLCAAHRAQKAQGRPLVPIGAAKRWWWPIESM
jgi:hypothetical protein